jgi:agmatinase
MAWEFLKDVLSRLEQGMPPPPWAGFLGASPRPEDCSLVLIPVPWDATVSYGTGTAGGPEAMIGASHQLDLEDGFFDRPYRAGITMLPEDREISSLNQKSREKATKIIETVEPHDEFDSDLKFVNEASNRVNDRVTTYAREQLRAGRLVGIVGGDHSCPYGLIKALAEQHKEGFGILHVDAHHDLRVAYEGFTHSHASIMHNVLKDFPALSIVQVGIRDYSRDEAEHARKLGSRCRVFYNNQIFRRKAKGESWQKLTRDMIEGLPQKVYVSFDIDGMDPTYCPSTGTPVPGGLSYDEAVYLLEELSVSGRTIVGFDLCEVVPGKGSEWDANVGARILYKLCGATLHSNKNCGLAADNQT